VQHVKIECLSTGNFKGIYSGLRAGGIKEYSQWVNKSLSQRNNSIQMLKVIKNETMKSWFQMTHTNPLTIQEEEENDLYTLLQAVFKVFPPGFHSWDYRLR
jgi:L-rhamnose mutarotase